VGHDYTRFEETFQHFRACLSDHPQTGDLVIEGLQNLNDKMFVTLPQQGLDDGDPGPVKELIEGEKPE
jgi:hypothetical protein